MRLRVFLSILVAFLSTLAAKADTFTFHYTLSNGGDLSATLTGNLQADHNTFDVTGQQSVTFNGINEPVGPGDFFSFAWDEGFTANPQGILTVDGSYEDLIDQDAITNNGFFLSVNNGIVGFENNISGSGFTPETDETFVLSRFSASTSTGVAATPEPSSLVLLGTGMLTACGALRRRFV